LREYVCNKFKPEFDKKIYAQQKEFTTAFDVVNLKLEQETKVINTKLSENFQSLEQQLAL